MYDAEAEAELRSIEMDSWLTSDRAMRFTDRALKCISVFEIQVSSVKSSKHCIGQTTPVLMLLQLRTEEKLV